MSDFNTNDFALSASRVMVTDTKGNPSTAAALTNGQLLIGSTGLSPVAASLTAGSGITITPGSGSISIAATAGPGPFANVTLSNLTSPTAINQDLLFGTDNTNNIGAVGASRPANVNAVTTTTGLTGQLTVAASGAITQNYTEANNDGNQYNGIFATLFPSGSADSFLAATTSNIDNPGGPVYTGTGLTIGINANNFACSTGYNFNTGAGNYGGTIDTFIQSGAGLTCGVQGGAAYGGSFTGTAMGVLGQTFNFGGNAAVNIGVAGEVTSAVQGVNCNIGGYFYTTSTQPDTLPIPADLTSATVALVANMDNAIQGDIFHGYCNTRVFTIDRLGNTFFEGGVSVGYETVAASGSLLANQSILGVTSTAAPVALALPSAASVPQAGYMLTIKDESGGAATNNITISATGGQTIDGAATVSITQNYGVIRLYSNQVEWFSR